MRQLELFVAKNKGFPLSRRGVKIEGITCRSALQRPPWDEYTLNPYRGCLHACVYGYCRMMQRFEDDPPPWGTYCHARTNMPNVLAREVKRYPPKQVMVGSVCDAWQWPEKHFGITRECLLILLKGGFTLRCLTKSDLIRRDFDVLSQYRNMVTIGVSLSTPPPLSLLWEPRASPPEERLKILAEAAQYGIPVYLSLSPLLPGLGDDVDSLSALFARIRRLPLKGLWVDLIHARSGVWRACYPLLAKRFPKLLPLWRKIFFDHGEAQRYAGKLRVRILEAAVRSGLRCRINLKGYEVTRRCGR